MKQYINQSMACGVPYKYHMKSFWERSTNRPKTTHQGVKG